MRCFGFASRPSSASPSPQLPSPHDPPATRPPLRPPSSSSAAPSEAGEGADPADAATSASPTTFNLLSREYTLAVKTHSYVEIWSKIHTSSSSSAAAAVRGGHGPGEREEEEEEDRLGRPDHEGGAAALSSSAHLIGEVLRPDRGSVDEALRHGRPGRLSRLVSDYFDGSEHTSRLCLRLHRCVDHARSIYAPLLDLLDVLPTPATTPASSPLSSSSPSRSHHQHPQAHHRLHHQHHHLSQTQCERAFDTFQEFSAHDNPFPAPGSVEEDGDGCFQEMRRCFAQLKRQLDHRLRRARARARLLRRTTDGSALCLVGAAVGITVTGLILALHAVPALAAAAPLLGFLRLPPGDPLASRQRRLREHIAQLDAAARGTYVLNNDLDTIERLVARLHATVESDRVLVRVGLSRGRGDRHPIEQVVGQLRRNRRGLLEQLHDLEEHVCLCVAAINRARSLLLQHIHSHHHHNGRDRSAAASSAANEDDEGQVQEPA